MSKYAIIGNKQKSFGIPVKSADRKKIFSAVISD